MYAQSRLKSTCAAGQTGQSSLFSWRNFASLTIWSEIGETSDQIAWMRRLIWLFAARHVRGNFFFFTYLYLFINLLIIVAAFLLFTSLYATSWTGYVLIDKLVDQQ